MDRPRRTKRVIRCEACGKIKRWLGSSKVWIEAITTNPMTGEKTKGGYLARICKECRPRVGYAVRKKKNEEKDKKS